MFDEEETGGVKGTRSIIYLRFRVRPPQCDLLAAIGRGIPDKAKDIGKAFIGGVATLDDVKEPDLNSRRM